MKYIEHYSTDNELMDYVNLPPDEKGRMHYRYSIIAGLAGKGNVIDIGSADSLLGKFIKGKYISIDISQINRAGNAPGIEGDILNIPLAAGSADNIILSETLEHITDLDRCMDEIHHALKENGVLIISVPNNEKIQYTLCIHCNRMTPLNAHLHSFTLISLKELLTSHGFIVRESFPFENRYLNMLKFFSLTGKMPYFLLRTADSIAKYFFNKYNKIIIKAQRASSSAGRAHPSQG